MNPLHDPLSAYEAAQERGYQRALEIREAREEAIAELAAPHMRRMINKRVNKLAGIEAGMRDKLTHLKKLMIINAQTIICNTVHRAIQAGASQRTAYQAAKGAIESFTASAGYLLAGGQ